MVKENAAPARGNLKGKLALTRNKPRSIIAFGDKFNEDTTLHTV